MSAALVETTVNQLDAAQALPEDHPLVPQLNNLFGEHTFFLDPNGLNIVEPAGPAASDAPSGKVLNVASWNSDRTSLTPHEPQATDVVVELTPVQPKPKG